MASNTPSSMNTEEELLLLQMNSNRFKSTKVAKAVRKDDNKQKDDDKMTEEMLLLDMQRKAIPNVVKKPKPRVIDTTEMEDEEALLLAMSKNIVKKIKPIKPIKIDTTEIEDEEALLSAMSDKKLKKADVVQDVMQDVMQDVVQETVPIVEITEEEYLAKLSSVKQATEKMTVNINGATNERRVNGKSNQKSTVRMPTRAQDIDLSNLPKWDEGDSDSGEDEDENKGEDKDEDEDEDSKNVDEYNDEYDDCDDDIVYGEFGKYIFKMVKGYVITLTDTEKQTFLSNQRSRGNFDPVEVINREKTTLEREQVEHDKLVQSLRGKADTKSTLTNPVAIERERLKQEMLTKKALKKAAKIEKTSNGAQKIKNKISAKTVIKELTEDEKMIANMMDNVHTIKSLEDMSKVTRKLSNMENILKALTKLFMVTTCEDLKKHLYIEISQIKPIMDMEEGSTRRALIKFRTVFSREEEINFCFDKRRNYMKPFSPLYIIPHVLEEFQREAVRAIDNGTSVVIGAPTSSGKSLISQYLASKNKRTLVILPTQELVDQYAGTVRNRPYKTLPHTPIKHLSGEQVYTDSDWVMLIGTPVDVWRYITLEKSNDIAINLNMDTFNTIGTIDHSQFDESKTFNTDIIEYVIIDELQQMNDGVDGTDNTQAVAMERIATYFADKVFVILSATIRNIDHVTKWFRYLKNDFGYQSTNDLNPTVIGIMYDKRFINQEKKVLNNGRMETMSPLSALTVKLIANGRLMATEMQFPAQQHLQLARNIIANHPTSIDLEPITFFDGKSITLQTCKEYEDIMKRRMTEIAIEDPEAMQHILDAYVMRPNDLEKLDIPELYTLLKEMQKNDMMNTIVFIFDTSLCRKTCYDLLNYMKTEELNRYPLWYTYRELQNSHAEALNTSLRNLEKAKFSKCDDGTAVNQKEDKAESLANLALYSFIDDVCKKISTEIAKWQELVDTINGQLTQSDHDIKNLELYQFRIKHYSRESDRYKSLSSLSGVNHYAPHPDYTFAKYTITEDIMRLVKHTIRPPRKKIKGRKAQLKAALEKKIAAQKNLPTKFRTPIDYKDPFMLCIERGFSFYTRELKELDERFQGIIQMLLLECGVQVLFNDGSLSVGVNLPLRTVLFYNPEYEDKGYITLSRILAHQAGGRSGRRGLDTTGYIVYAGINYSNLILGEYLDIVGVGAIDRYVTTPLLFNSKFCVSKLCKISLSAFNDADSRTTLLEKESAIRLQMINDFNTLEVEFRGQSPMHIYRLRECVSNAIDIQDFCMFLTLQSFEGKILHKYDFVIAIASLIFIEDYDNSGTFVNTQVTGMLDSFCESSMEKGKIVYHGYSSKITDCYKSNVIEQHNMSQMLRKIKIVKEVIRILYSNNQLLTTQWVIDAEKICIDLNNLVFKYTI